MPDAEGLVRLLTGIGVFLVVGLLFYAMIVLIARTMHRFMPATSPQRDPAMDALRTRFATGEIDEAEFERLRSVLQGR
jgi:uncharacterized membrane protein